MKSPVIVKALKPIYRIPWAAIFALLAALSHPGRGYFPSETRFWSSVALAALFALHGLLGQNRNRREIALRALDHMALAALLVMALFTTFASIRVI
jgi:hypothetical protein